MRGVTSVSPTCRIGQYMIGSAGDRECPRATGFMVALWAGDWAGPRPGIERATEETGTARRSGHRADPRFRLLQRFCDSYFRAFLISSAAQRPVTFANVLSSLYATGISLRVGVVEATAL